MNYYHSTNGFPAQITADNQDGEQANPSTLTGVWYARQSLSIILQLSSIIARTREDVLIFLACLGLGTTGHILKLQSTENLNITRRLSRFFTTHATLPVPSYRVNIIDSLIVLYCNLPQCLPQMTVKCDPISHVRRH